MRTPPIIKDGESIEVCAWCYPGRTVLLDYPCLRHLPISHGLCKTHLAGMEAEMGEKLARKAEALQSAGGMHIAILLVLALLATVSAADSTDVEDLGVITENVGIGLKSCQDRRDCTGFVLELLPQSGPSNRITIHTTNHLITIDQLVAVPHGVNIMGVKTEHADGSESPVKLFKLDLRRDPPSAPSAYRTFVSRKVTPYYTNAVMIPNRLHRTNSLESPPIPGQTNKPAAMLGLPLPNGSPKTYSQHMDEMRATYAHASEKRRSE